ncbi:TraB/GumN family protein [Loktanella agnita]|uniref:TraB/GumN family protein n=1 Tax=Loktanella agnita TaxID=287097 RepID=UPI003986E87A
MFLRSAAIAALTLTTLPAWGQCVGDNYLDQLSPTQQADLTKAVSDLPFAEGLIWEATQDDTRMTVVGTVHIYDPRLDDIYLQIAADVVAADLVLLEATPKEEAELQDLISTDPGRLFITEGPTLPEVLDDETWTAIADAAQARNIPGFMAAKMQPWYLSLVLSIPPCAAQDMVNGNRGLDHMISQGASDAGVPMQALEPFTTLFDIFQDEPIDDQIEMLMINLMTPDIQQQMFVALLDRYFAQDVGRLWEMSRIAMTEIDGIDPAAATALFAETEQSLLIDRNRNWMPVIAEAANANDTLIVAVGAAHLIGPDGLLQLLQDDGWALTRIE